MQPRWRKYHQEEARMKASYLFVFLCMIASLCYALELPEAIVLVEGGTFHNGSGEVSLNSYYIGKNEVTQAEYQAVAKTKKSFFADKPNNPVECVSWFEAIAYCNNRSRAELLKPCYSFADLGTNPADWPVGWYLSAENQTKIHCDWEANGYRLPTEMEWYYAAMGGKLSKGYKYSGSDDWAAVGWFRDYVSPEETKAVGTKSPNELGIYDMSGNVSEWCWDLMGELGTEPLNNPKGAESGMERIIRGGNWFANPDYSPINNRKSIEPQEAGYNIGFRVCRNAE